MRALRDLPPALSRVLSLVLSLAVMPVVGAAGLTGNAFAQSSAGSGTSAGSETPEGSAARPADASDPAARAKPKLGIDSLLRPRAMTTPPAEAPARPTPTDETRGGRSREAWARAFIDARAELREAEQGLEKSRKKMTEASQSGGGYTYNPLGGTSSESSPTDPDVQKARAQMDRDRKAIEAARKRLRDLDVEASLAGVPDAWIPPDPDTLRSSPKVETAPADTPHPQ